ncbi:hypothetical protein [Aliamphritea spongicola]|uniref:hypothetical protein n=1 Tax=Aliamphritea spongicola TaxID=707589 RepID=UPI00196A9BCC|nr:hypothetical protein [Aliamphritea spongicola]MBN3561942.1 hypothetical protein [Aliamphritea spongicola]
MASWLERIFAALIPLICLLVYLALPYYAILIPLTSYFIAKQYGSDFVADYALKFFDVLVSALIIISLVALLEFALVIATGDGQLPLPAISVGSLTMITGMLALLYSFVMSIIFMLFPLMGSELKIPVSLRVFEILRGRRKNIPSTIP